MAMTKEQAIEHLTFFYETYLPSRVFYSDAYMNGINMELKYGGTVESAYAVAIKNLIVSAGNDGAFPEYPVNMHYAYHADEYVADLPPAALVDFLYPTASSTDRDALTNAAESGTVSNIGLVHGLVEVLIHDNTPTAADVLEAVLESLPDPEPTPNGFDVTDSQLDFLVGIYVSAFNRAPENEGLTYWAGALNEKLNQGISEQDAFKAIAADIYWAGEQNHESGTSLSNAQYVTYLYQSVLNRAPDAGGHDHWVQELDSGSPRSEFIAVFLTSAIQATGDSTYVWARIEIGKFVGQETMSGPNVPLPDLVGVLQGVHDTTSAQAAMVELIEWQQEVMFGQPAALNPTARTVDFDLFASTEFDDSPYAQSSIDHAGVDVIGQSELNDWIDIN